MLNMIYLKDRLIFQLKLQIMKESKAQVEVTFASALKTIKSSKSLQMDQFSTSKDSRRQISMMKNSKHMLASKKRITERRNLTLMQLCREYQMNPSIEYVIRAKEKDQKIKRQQSFEDWMKNIKSDYGIQQQPSEQRKLITKRQEKQSEKIRDEISKNISVLAQKLKKRQTQTTQQSFNEGDNSSHADTKYSFSRYFSECSQIQQRDASKKAEIITKISIGNQLVPNLHMNQREGTDPKYPSSKSPRGVILKSDQQSEQNKQNLGSLYNTQNSESKIMGLQFSKNKRFKSTKKKRRELNRVN